MKAAEQLVIRCPAVVRPDALRRLHDDLPAEQRPAFVAALEQTGPGESPGWDGLFVATAPDGTAPAAAAWVQPAPGNTAFIWPPAFHAAAAEPLLAAAAAFCVERRIPLAQLIITEFDGHRPDALKRCGFAKLADLDYLFADTRPHARDAAIDSADSATQMTPRLNFSPAPETNLQRLAAVLEQTYVETLDCPALEGLRDMADVIAGYRAYARYLPQHWYIVEAGGRDVGSLILAAHPDAGSWELVYMGLVPAARGRGLGRQIVDFALQTAANSGADRLVAAVDSANQPALSVYRRAGFIQWDHRTAYAPIAPPVA